MNRTNPKFHALPQTYKVTELCLDVHNGHNPQNLTSQCVLSYTGQISVESLIQVQVKTINNLVFIKHT